MSPKANIAIPKEAVNIMSNKQGCGCVCGCGSVGERVCVWGVCVKRKRRRIWSKFTVLNNIHNNFPVEREGDRGGQRGGEREREREERLESKSNNV